MRDDVGIKDRSVYLLFIVIFLDWLKRNRAINFR